MLSSWILGIGLALCLGLSAVSLKKAGLRKEGVIAFIPLSCLFGFFFAHFFYCVMRFGYAWYDMMPDQPHGLAFLVFWCGNYMLYGGALGVLLAAWLSVRIGKGKLLPTLDALSPWAALMIAIVRLYQGMKGKFYSLELEGEEDEWGEMLPTGFEGLPWSIYDDYYEVWHWALFMAAIVVALILCVCLMRKTNHPAGDRFLLLCGGYSALQIVLEGLRRDDVLRWGFVRCSQLIAALLVITVTVVYCRRAGGGKLRRKVASFGMVGLGVGVCLLMEFAQEQRITALLFLNRGMCYLISALSCLMLVGAILLMRSAEAELYAHRK